MEAVGSSGNSNIPFTDWRSARDNLRKWREEKKRRSFDVLHLGSVLLAEHGRKLGDESMLISRNIKDNNTISSMPHNESEGFQKPCQVFFVNTLLTFQLQHEIELGITFKICLYHVYQIIHQLQSRQISTYVINSYA